MPAYPQFDPQNPICDWCGKSVLGPAIVVRNDSGCVVFLGADRSAHKFVKRASHAEEEIRVEIIGEASVEVSAEAALESLGV